MYENPGLYNADCMEAMKEFPDNFFDLAIVDPPYGGGFTEGGGCKGWFSKYHQNVENTDIGGVERQGITRSDCERKTEITRTGGTWASKYAKKFLRGTLPRNRSILRNCSVFHATRLYGAVTISCFLRQGVLLYGES